MREIRSIVEQAKALHEEIVGLRGVRNPQPRLAGFTLESTVTDPSLYRAVAKLFHDGHHAEAVKKACVFLNNEVKRRTKSTADGAALMRGVFSPKKPKLQLNAMSNQSEEDEQQGYMDILAGVMTGIRNPRAHEHDWEDTEERALQLLSLINHLVIRVRDCELKS